MRQAVDRHHQNLIFDPLDAPGTDETDDAKGTVAGPSSPAPRQPRRLLAHPSEMANSSRSRPQFRSARSPTSQCLPHPATGANAAAASPPPAAERAHAAPRPPTGRRLDCDQRAKASAERRDQALRPRGAAARREPAVLLAARVVHAAAASSSQPAPKVLSLSVGSAIARSCHRRQTVLDVRCRTELRPLVCPLRGSGPRLDQTNSGFCGVCRHFANTATGIRSRPSPARFDPLWLEMTSF
jgi:hypothetical protein